MHSPTIAWMASAPTRPILQRAAVVPSDRALTRFGAMALATFAAAMALIGAAGGQA
jgi:hypothetical protein